jgi:hypothetical protein
MRRTSTIVAAAACLVVMTAPAAYSGPDRGPESSGVVTRFAEPGANFLFDVEGTVGRETRPLVALFNVASTAMFCAMELAGPGDLQLVETPSGNRSFLVHADVPVIVFDVTGLGTTHPEVFSQLPAAICVDDLQPIAVGEARLRTTFSFKETNQTFQQVVAATGVVTDGETTWNLTAHRRARAELPLSGPPSDVRDDLRLTARGR